MFAVIKTGGKQYRVAKDDYIVVEKLAGDAGETCVFGDVLMIGEGDNVDIGAPVIGGAQVVGEVVEQRRAAKITIYKTRQRNTYMRKKGHRQHETLVKITDILAKGGAKVEAKKAAPKPAAKKEEAPAAKAAPAASEGGDNLTKLTGVGKVMAGKLNEAGLTTYGDVAGLTAERFAELDETIFKGRVPHDQLVSEAKDLAK